MDTRVVDTLVPPDHELRRVKRLIDVERWRDLITDGYSPAMGRTADDPMRLITLACLPCHDHRWDREVMAAAQVNVACRYVLDLSLASRVPVPRVLAQCRTRLGAQRHQARFDQVVTHARAYGLIRDRRRRKDATHVLANIAVPSTLRLVAQTRQRLLDAARPDAPEPVATAAAAAEVVRQATADLPETDRLVARVTHLRAIVTWADAVQQALGPLPVSPDTARTRFEAALALAHRVLADRDDPDTGDQVRRVVDPDARRGTHGASVEGYRLESSVDADSAGLTALNRLPGHGDEARDAPTRLAAEPRTQGNAVEALAIDGIGWHGAVLRALSAPEGLGLEVSVPPPAPAATPWFGPEACVLDAPQGGVTCPGGPQTATQERRANHTGWTCVLARRQCAGCPQPAQCLTTLPQKQGRRVIKHDAQAEYDAARARATTPGDAAVRQPHPRVERQVADIVRYHDGRRRRYRGQWRVKVQYLLTGLVVHVKRRVQRLGAHGAPPAWQPASSSWEREKDLAGTHGGRRTPPS